ncbi:MAG: hypothetical protein HGB20_06345 [Chlorobiaceae bacterium]|nr:hypothetical protein [Chlorobiaceae bacterium]
MKATKALVAAGLAVMLGAGTASAQDGKIGLGYQGIIAGDFLNGVSARYWFDKNWGAELNVFYGTAGLDFDNTHAGDADLLLGTAKVLYAPVVKATSKFYVGIEGGLGSVGGDNPLTDNVDISLWTISPLFGVEYSFSDIPELGLNFEVGYKFHHVNADTPGPEIDVNVDGTFVSLGAHYYL